MGEAKPNPPTSDAAPNPSEPPADKFVSIPDRFFAAWDSQPLGLVMFTLVWLVLCVPGLLVLYVVETLLSSRLALMVAGESVFAFASMASLIVVTVLVLRRPWSDTGLPARGIVLDTLAGYLIGGALISFVVHILVLGHWMAFTGSHPYKPWLALLLCLLIALTEEGFFRGYVLPAFERRWGTTAALLASSFIFGALHLFSVEHQPFGEQARVFVFISLEAGLLMGAAYIATRRLWLPIGIHVAWNFFLGPYYGAPVSGFTEMGSYTTATLHGPAWITGGNFGPEAGVVACGVGTIFSIALIIVAVRAGQWRAAPGAVNATS